MELSPKKLTFSKATVKCAHIFVIQSCDKITLLGTGTRLLGHGFSEKEILSSLKFSSREGNWENKLSDFAKFQFLINKIDQKTNFAKLPSAKWLFLYCCKFHYSRLEVLQNSRFNFLSQILTWEEKLREQENCFFRKSRPKWIFLTLFWSNRAW